MKKIPNKTFEELEKLYNSLDNAQDVINEQIEEINGYIEHKILHDLSDVVEKYNSIIRNINEIRAEQFEDAETYCENRSDAWHESDRGEIFTEWKDNLEEQHDEMDEIEFEPIEKPDFEELWCPDQEVPYE